MSSRRLFRTDRELLSVIVRRHPPGPPIDVVLAEDALATSRPGVRGGIPGHKLLSALEGEKRRRPEAVSSFFQACELIRSSRFETLRNLGWNGAST